MSRTRKRILKESRRFLMKSPIISQIDDSMVEYRKLLSKLDADKKQNFLWKLEMSWIFHDSAIDGVVLSDKDLVDAFNVQVVTDISLQPLYNEIRNHKIAIDYIKSIVSKKSFTINQEILRRLQNIFTGEGLNSKSPIRYRREIPIHRMYFHEILTSRNMANVMKQFFDWANSKETRKMHPIAYASVVNYRFMRIFPFATHSGKIGRMVMNAILMKDGYLPAIIHAAERQAYYESLRESADVLQDLIERSLYNTITSNIRILKEMIYGERHLMTL